jgi:hypothetical protein
MEKYLRDRQTVLLLHRSNQKKKGGHAKRMIVINRLRQDVVGIARVVSKYCPLIFPKLI